MTRVCECCGQALPVVQRRDPPLPPLNKPALVTIHDLPRELRASVGIRREKTGGGDVLKIVLPGEDQ